MNKTASFLCLLLFSFYCNASVTWEKLFVKSSTDVFRCVQEVPSGGYIAAGYTAHWSSNDTDAFVVRLTTNGDTLWTRTFNGGKKDLFYKVVNTTDGGFVLCGYTSSYSSMGDYDAYYMKLDGNGNELWHFIYDNAPGTNERAQDIIQTADGGYAMVGYTNSGQPSFNAFLVKIDANGGQTWVKKYGGATTYDDANSIKELPDGGFIMAGQTVPIGNLSGEIFLVRTNSSGDTCWTKSFGSGVVNASENAEDIQISNSGGFIICGSTNGLGAGAGVDNGYLVKTDTGGVMQWYKTFGGTEPDDFHRVENTSDNGYILTGSSQSNATMISNIWLYKTDANGDSSWAYTFGGANHDHGYSGLQTSDGGYILCGYSASFGFNYEDALIIKVDSNGLLYNHLIYTTATALVSPVNGSCGSPNASVTITVYNFGDTAVTVFPDTVQITGSLVQTLGQTFNTTVYPGNPINHTFTSTINTSAGGVLNFHCFTSTNNDVYPAMNSCDSTITINGLPSPPVAVGDTTCGTGTVTLTATSPYALDWFASSTGGSSLGTGPSYSTTISNTTTFYVQASNACGTSSRTAVTAYEFPVTAAPMVFSAQRCGPGSVTLLASSGSPISWWDSATGGTMLQGNLNSYVVNVTTTTIFYVEAGTGTPCPSARVPVTATVNPLPDAGFTPNASAVCLGDAFQFTNTTTGAVGYSWDFGDATGTSVQTNPTYTYAQTGNYMVRLIAISAQNCNDTIIIPVSVTTAPQVSFSAAITSGCIPFTVTFANATTNATDYLWNFGDGSTSTDVNPVHDYQSEGTFTVTLLATVGSCADSDSVVGMITTHTPPIVDLGPDISTNSVSYQLDAGAGFQGYLWNNGETTETITAGTDGVYCVVVTDNNTCSDSDCVSVILDAAGIGNITGDADLIYIYPNPVSRFAVCNIYFEGKTNTQLRVFDAVGNQVLKMELFNSCQLPISVLKPGVYFIEINNGDHSIRRKLMVY